MARAQINASLSAKASDSAAQPAAACNVWEHVDLFDDPPTADPPPLSVPLLAAPSGRHMENPDDTSAPPTKRRCSAAGRAGVAEPALAASPNPPANPPSSKPSPPPDADDEVMAAVFRRIRRRLDRLRRYNRAGRHREAREQAATILGAAAAAGCRRIAGRAARLVSVAGYLAAAAVDEVEVQLDAAEAIWRSSRCVI